MGREVHLIWMTDGAAGGTPPGRRAKESRFVLAANGLQRAYCTFLGIEHSLPDSCLHQHVPRALVALEEHLDGLDGPLELWLPAWEGGHQDHDTTHAIGRFAGIERRAAMRQYPIYHGADLPGPMFRVLSPLPGTTVVDQIIPNFREILKMLAACLCYRSQWRSFLGLLPMITLHLMLFRRPIVLCAVEMGMPASRPHAGALLYERRTPWRWDDLQAALSGLRQ